MAFVQFSKVSLAFGDRDILKNVSVNLQAGTKSALTGANGAGKSTLIKIMAGLIEPDSGERIAQKDSRIAYLPQSGLVHSGCSLKEEADKAFQWGYDIQKKADEIGELLKSNPSNSDKLAVEYSELIARRNRAGIEEKCSVNLYCLGLDFPAVILKRERKNFLADGRCALPLQRY